MRHRRHVGTRGAVTDTVRRHPVIAIVVVLVVVVIGAVAYRATREDDIPEGPCISDVVDTCEDQTYAPGTWAGAGGGGGSGRPGDVAGAARASRPARAATVRLTSMLTTSAVSKGSRWVAWYSRCGAP